MITASELVDAIGRKKLGDAVGVGPTAISNAVVRGRLPATWFLICKSFAELANVDCPPELFGIKPLPFTQNVDETPDCKGAA